MLSLIPTRERVGFRSLRVNDDKTPREYTAFAR